MKNPYKSFCLIAKTFFLLPTLLCTSAVAFAQGLTLSEEAVIKSEAQRHVELYYNFYYEQNPQALSTQIFTVPWFAMGANGITTYTTVEENLDYFSSAIAGLLERGWDKSTFRTKNVCIFGAGSAIVSGTNTRTRQDGSIMSLGGVSYVLGTTGDGWRIISFASHSAGKVVRCDAE
tara:strand:+ start:683 stop:1210 length:528 start_codon:yes stop_codon:yes gene_type:complete